MFITDATHFDGAIGDSSAPEPARQVALFIQAVVAAGRADVADKQLSARVPCMAGPSPRNWCYGFKMPLSRLLWGFW